MDLYKQFPNSPLNFDENFEILLLKFKQFKITIFDLLNSSSLEISYKINTSVTEIDKFISILKKNEVFKIQNTYLSDGDVGDGEDNDDQSINCFTTGDSKIDEMLGGGIRTGMITEIFGESSTGKSQICMQLTKTCMIDKQNNGLNGNVVYISTEGNLETKRLIEINSNIEKIFYINCSDFESQQHILNVQLPILINNFNYKIKLIIIDSISHHLRVELLNKNFNKYEENLKIINNLVLHLNNLAIDNKISIVVTNQISDKFNTKILNTDFKKISYDYQIGWLSGWCDNTIKTIQENNNDNDINNHDNKIPTLGLNWTNNIGVRILVKKNYKLGYNNDNNNNNKELNNNDNWIMERSMKLIFSPFKNQGELKFKIVKNGIISCD